MRSFSMMVSSTALMISAVPGAADAASEAGAVEQSSATPAASPIGAPASEANVPPQSGEVMDIVVTAQLRSQSLQAVPAAITAINGADLTKIGSTSLVDVSKLVPGLRISPNRSGTLIFLRGVGQTLTGSNADPQVAVNLNGVYVPPEITSAAFFDVDRVEALPGPQGTLYGRNATGGVINIISRRPGDTTAANGFIELGNYGRIQGLLAVDMPLSDTMALRSTLNLIRHSGYFDNGTGDQKTVNGRLTAVWKPGDATTVTAIGSYSYDGGYGDTPQYVPPAGGRWRHLAYDPRANNIDNDSNIAQFSLTAEHELTDKAKITYIGGYNRIKYFNNSLIYPLSSFSLLRATLKQRATSQEVRMNAGFGRLEAVGGLYYSRVHADATLDVNVAAPVKVYDQYSTTSKSAAAFGQLTYSVLDSLRLTGGVRYTWARRSIDGFSRTTITGAPPPRNVPYLGRDTDQRLDWRAGAEFDLARDSMLYGNVATGFTPGGRNNSPSAPGSTMAGRFEPVKLTAYTAGVKNKLAGGVVTLNLEGFYYDYKNYQVSARNPINGINTVYNAEKAEVYGAQLDSKVRIGRTDNLSLGVSYVRARAIKLVTAEGNFDGNTLPYAPKLTINATYSHVFPLDNGGNVEAAANTSYSSDRFALYSHIRGTRINGNTNTNLNLTYNAQAGRWSLGAFVRNIENHITFGGGSYSATGVPPLAGPGVPPGGFSGTAYLLPPRTFGGIFSFNF